MDSFFRYQVVIFAMLFIDYCFYILCRKSFSFVIPTFMQSENLRKEDLGVIVSSLNIAYALSKFIVGILSDRISARVLFFFGLLCSGLTLVGFSYAHSMFLYASLSFLNGLFLGCGWPACAKLLRQWFRPSQFGTVWSVLSASINVTGAVVPLFLPWILPGHGWRGFMLFSGILCIFSAFAALLLIKNSPQDVGLPPVFAVHKKTDGDKKKSTGSWSDLLRSRFLWRLSFYYFVVFLAKTVCENWAQLLLLEEKKLSPVIASGFISSFEVGGMLSSFATGYITDMLMAKNKASGAPAASPRMKIVMAYFVVSFFAIICVAYSSAFLPFFAFLLGATLYGNINIFGIVATEEAPVHLSGSSHAIVSLAANFGAVLAGYPFSVLATITSLTFTFYATAALFGVCLTMLAYTRSFSTKIAHTD